MKKSIIILLMLAVVVAAVWALYGSALTALMGHSASPEAEEVEKVAPVGPAFSADSAYAYCAAQCDFGPRTMNSEAHDRCEEWIISEFKRHGLTVTTQKADLKGWDGTTLKSTNIMASYKPEATTRLLFCAHWDSRPWADNDPDSTNHRRPVMAANDGASGVAVMLELARVLKASQGQGLNPAIGIDFVCFDAEDYGTPYWGTDDGSDPWALGAQYWSQNLPQGYEARYGVLLDMVGGQGAKFYREYMSLQYAEGIVKKVWRAARSAGYGSYFPRSDGGAITDDHIPVNKNAHIPCIDIIPFYPDCEQSTFGPTWHTVSDDMDHIDRGTLKAVGQTMVQVIWSEE